MTNLMYLELENGVKFIGNVFGYQGQVAGELVFQTGITGYPETLTDPSYAKQILVFTTPLINNYGMPSTQFEYLGDENNNDNNNNQNLVNNTQHQKLDNNYESLKPALSAIVVEEYTENSSHYDNLKSLHTWCLDNEVVGISGIDTRHLTQIIREEGDCRARIYPLNPIENELIPFLNIGELDLVSSVSCPEKVFYSSKNNYPTLPTPDGKKKIILFDCGCKNSQILAFLNRGIDVLRVPNSYLPSEEELQEYDGIFLSNGPGNPETNTGLIKFLKGLINRGFEKPIFGICLGHQLMGLSQDITIEKMKYGNRGQNIPVEYILSDGNQSQRCLITSQNHGYCLSNSSIEEHKDWRIMFKNANDNSNEGFCHTKKPYFSVQFHPEARPGPEDANFLFDVFHQLLLDTTLNVSSLVEKYLKIERQNSVELKTQDSDIIKKEGKVLIIGSGGLSIGQAGEFDYSGSQAIKAFKEEGLETLLVNPNIATIQTSIADKVFYTPITKEFISQIIEKERPNYITVSFGGQTALNVGVQLWESGVLDKWGVEILGTNLKTVQITEDRYEFKEVLKHPDINLEVPPSHSVTNVDDALQVANDLGYPVLVRAGFCLGGQGSGFASNDEELVELVEKALSISDVVIIDRSLKGWKELEYEIIRDANDNCICICNMENLDPLGVHTGESIVVAPSQTLNDIEYQSMRSACFRIVRHLQIVGECNVQFTLDPNSSKFYVIEMNARLSRSSALASKATGYPLAYVAAKIGLGYPLPRITNNVTGTTTACFEPSLDYLVIKIPRWDLTKFDGVSYKLGSHMKSVGEVMGIGRDFREALMKTIRMSGMFGETELFNVLKEGVFDTVFKEEDLLSKEWLSNFLQPNYQRMLRLFMTMTTYKTMYSEMGNSEIIDKIYIATKIDRWFLWQILSIVELFYTTSKEVIPDNHLKDVILSLKQYGFSDNQISHTFKNKLTSLDVKNIRYQYNILPKIKQIDTVAGEFPCHTNYLYLTYLDGNSDACLFEVKDKKELVIVLGSGVYRIGSSVEFDWCSVSCVRKLRELGYNTIMINHNPETVSTDYDEADKLFFEELTPEIVSDIYYLEKHKVSSSMDNYQVKGLVMAMGGQSANNIVMELHKNKIPILGTSPEMIDNAENRYKFSRLLDTIGIDQPEWKELTTLDDAREFCHKVNYPCLVRPSYVLSGAGMTVVYTDEELDKYLGNAKEISPDYPVVVSKFIDNAKEIEVDAVAQNGKVVILAISEHIENAGVHSGDATLVLPAQDLTPDTIERIKQIVFSIGSNLNVNGPFNLQLIAKDDKLKVIECNLRVSRSFPFASKTLNINLIDIATKVIIQPEIDISSSIPSTVNFDRIGVKVPQFSFHRLEGANYQLGVEMASTGEVACFGNNRNIAYLKALMSTGFKIAPITNTKALISIGDLDCKEELLASIKFMFSMGWNVEMTAGTGKYYQQYLHLDKGKNNFIIYQKKDYGIILDKIKQKQYDVVINVSSKCVDKVFPVRERFGFQLRRLALDFQIPLLINIKKAKLYMESVYYYYHNAKEFNWFYDTRYNISNIDNSNDNNNNLMNTEKPNKMTLAPTVIQNALQCISYQEKRQVSRVETKVVFKDKHIMDAKQFNRNMLRQIFLRSQEIMYALQGDNTGIPVLPLSGKVIGLLFYTPSSRTRCSFESAIKKLGGNTILLTPDTSSSQKGESVGDTIQTLDTYTDGLIIRSPNDITIQDYQNETENTIINAGDMEEHPSQALLDLFTIRQEKGTVNNLKFAIMGDLSHSRTIGSLVELLCNYNVEFHFIATQKLQINPTIIDYIENAKKQSSSTGYNITYFIHTENLEDDNVKNVLKSVDVVYMTRLQKERWDTVITEQEVKKYYLTKSLVNTLKSNSLIMHPLPRNNEIPKEIDTDRRAIYFKQMKYGLYLRMTLCELMFGEK